MDYRRHLGASAELVMLYLGGATVDAADRTLRVEGDARVGWWRFRAAGRRATPIGPAEPPDLSGLPAVRGYAIGEWLVGEGGRTERVHLLPDDEPPLFSPLRARRWHGGALVFEELEFESGIEEEVRRALEDGRSLVDVRGVPAPLRAAYAYALVDREGRTLGVPISPFEIRKHVAAIASEGRERAAILLRDLEARRNAEEAVTREARFLARAREAALRPVPEASLEERVQKALEAAGARLRRLRRMARDLAEVIWDFEGGTFLTLIDERGLRVLDAGICLAGHDAEVTLESLPAVVREAIEIGEIVVTRHEPMTRRR